MGNRTSWSRRISRLLVSATALLSATAMLAACGNANNASSGGTQDTLTIGVVNPPAGINPINQTDVVGQWAVHYTLDPLLEQPTPLKFEPKLASSFETTDDQTYTIKIDPKAKWSDGQPVTADDVVYTLNLIANPDSQAKAFTGNITTIEGVNGSTGKLDSGTSIPGVAKVDDSTVTIKTKTPVDPNYVEEMIGTKIPILPYHTLKDIPADQFDKSDFATKGPTVYSGPYKMTSYSASTSIQYTANEKYYKGAPKIKKIILKIMPAANLAGELEAGTVTVNAAGGIGGIPVTDIETVKALKNATTKVTPDLGFQTMQFNTKKFAKAEVRYAIAEAINRPQIVSTLLKGEGAVIDGPYTSLSPYQDKDLPVIKYDPAKAKADLTAAGWDFSTPINFVVPTGNSVREQSADIILQNLKAVGLNVKETKFDFPTVLGMGQKGQFDLILIGLSFNIDPDVSSLYGPKATYNFTGWEDSEATALLRQGKAVTSTDDRHKIYNRLQEIWQKQMPILTTYTQSQVIVKNNSLKVGGPGAFWNGSLANLPDWTFGAN